MRAAIVGTGYVGLVSGACLAELGHEILCLDHDAGKIARLIKGEIPIYEPGLEQICARNVAAGRLRFGTDLAQAAEAELILLAVGTPPHPDTGEADLRPLYAAAEAAARHLAPGAVLVVKSTVPVGTNRALAAHLRALRPEARIEVASNPEFLREGAAVTDFLHPDRVVAGAESAAAHGLLAALYAPLTARGVPLLATGLETAELIKYAANAFLALKIAYANEIADLCEAVGADVEAVTRGMGQDARIGARHLKPGPGYGGSCFPKDTLALSLSARAAGAPATLVEAAILANDLRKAAMAEKIRLACGGELKGRTLAVLGLAFKAGTDDMRESPSLAILPRLQAMGARIRAYDPAAMEAAAPLLPGVEMAASARAALAGADGAVVTTEWPEFAALGLREIARLLKTPILVDLRNIFAPEEAASAGLAYSSIGRPPAGEPVRMEALWRADAAEESRAAGRLPEPQAAPSPRAAGATG